MSINFKDLNLTTKLDTKTVKTDSGIELAVRTYLPLAEKTSFIEYVVDHALDEKTGCFSPVRIETFYNLALAHYYAGINFEDGLNAAEVYDALQTNEVFAAIKDIVGDTDDLIVLTDLLYDTTHDIARYNNSLAGMLNIASTEATGLDSQLSQLMEKIRDKNGIELLEQMKEVNVG